ncbi:peptide deformylase [uncultured Roseobacter sp.]|uniref:peptide deformylase n=1 Tax=uncultured Roseobacter sp. TaxID=114847 RepID=UPI002628A9BC|nr:peptide deformylase [uncultured Roseobacter sp.]
MTVRDIVRWPDPRLSTVCAPVAAIDADLRVLAADMLETMYAAPGRGLAGPQVGAMSRIFVMDTDWKEGTPAPLVFINPAIDTRSAARATQTEGCLSIPGVSAEIERPAEVTVAWTDLEGARHVRAFTGFAAACVQHELDHLDGIVTFDYLTPDTRARLEAEYAEAVQ